MKAFLASTALLLACATIWSGPADDLVKNGDEFDRKLQASRALDFYLVAEKLEPKNAGLLLRIARQYRHLMADATTREEKLRLGGRFMVSRLKSPHARRALTERVLLTTCASFGSG